MTEQRLQEIERRSKDGWRADWDETLALVAEVRAQAATIATLTRERDEARAAAERFRQSMYATEESSAAQYARAERLQAVRDDCVRNEAALIADRDTWKAKAEAADALPDLPKGWVQERGAGWWECEHRASGVALHADAVGAAIYNTRESSDIHDAPFSDLITVLRHAERAHQELKGGPK